ncbi:hypothetical protein AB205_0182580 [Aquarana catesbeiana]|uniref:Uncharacterized protein n=1 Tax=Aquarana catesbeiana TaxID=8400 RepID=A0A2G9QAI5_AQUCT|nr:hypothetical protein AB205_0182580 [Aquarana catesbeiana]
MRGSGVHYIQSAGFRSALHSECRVQDCVTFRSALHSEFRVQECVTFRVRGSGVHYI